MGKSVDGKEAGSTDGRDEEQGLHGGVSDWQEVSVDEEIDTDDFKGTATDRKLQELQKQTAKQLDYMPVVYLTAALAMVGIVTNMVNPMVFGDQVSDSFDLTALGKIVLPSASGATVFAAIGLGEGQGIFPRLMGRNINAAEQEATGLKKPLLATMSNPMRATTADDVDLLDQVEAGSAHSSDEGVNWDELRQKNKGPDLVNTAYSTTYMIAAGTAFFIALNLVDVAIEMLAELDADETASKVVGYALTSIINLFLGLSFPEIIKAFDHQLRACMPNAGLQALQLPEHLGLDNGAAFMAIGLLKVLSVELGYGLMDPLYDSLLDAAVAGGLVTGSAIFIDNCVDNVLSKGVNKAVKAVGSGIGSLATCDLKSLCPSNDSHARLSTDSH